MRRILLVEDDESLGSTLQQRLIKDYDVTWASTYTQAMQNLRSSSAFDLVLLDVGLPDGSGFDLAEKFLRSENSPSLDTPAPRFLFLTAQADAESRLRGFELGAEEFIPKPFHLKELLLRIQHIFELHEPRSNRIAKLELEDGVVDFVQMSIRRAGQAPVFPSANEIRVLQYLIEQSPKVVSRDQIMDAVWGADKNPSHRSIDNMIVHLRDLLGKKNGPCIRSVRGIGYQWLRGDS